MRCVAAVVVCALAPGCAEIRGARLYDRGTLALDRGDASTAVRELEEAARLVPQASEIQNHLGLAYLALGRRNEARAAFTRALELDCDNRAARANLRVMDANTETAQPPLPDTAARRMDTSAAPKDALVDHEARMPETLDGR